MHWSDFFGWFGFGVVLLSYFMVALQRWRVRSVPNQLGNIVGPGLLGINSLIYKAWALVALNMIWALIAVYMLTRMLREPKKT